MDEDTYRRRLRERRIREIKRNRAILALVIVIILIIGCIALIFNIRKKLDNSGDRNSVSVASGSAAGLASAGANIPLDTRSQDEGSSLANEGSGSVLASEGSSKTGSKSTSDKKSSASSEKADNPEVSAKKANAYFKGTAFIGDSRTQGLQINSGVTSADFLAGRGLNVSTIYDEKVINNKYTVLQALSGKKYKKIYICFGLNELGWAYPDKFIEKYEKLIDDIAKRVPDADIVVESIAPVTKEKSHSDKVHNMKHVHKYNKLIKAMCKEKKLTYLDVTPAVVGDDGYLPEGAATDGIHMNKEYCKKIISYIVNNKY